MDEQHDDGPGVPEQKSDQLENGHAHFDAGRYAEALEAYHRACLLDPEDPECWNCLALTYANLDFPREAWRSYLLAIKIDPANSSTLWYAGEFLYGMEDLGLARAFLLRCASLEQDPDRLGEVCEVVDDINSRIGPPSDESTDRETAALLKTGSIESDSTAAPDEEPGTAVEAEELPVEIDEDFDLDSYAENAPAFVACLTLKLSGFEAACRNCGASIPYDAPYCYLCKMPHFYGD